MADSRSPSTAVIALVAIAAVAALAGGLLGGRQEMQLTETHPFVPEDHPVAEAVVVTKLRHGGFSAFGLSFSQPEHHVRVAFTVPSSCEVGNAEQWPTADQDCAGPARLSGQVAGGGRAATGDTIVLVDVQVESACYDATELGRIWPLRTAACKAPS